MRVVLDTNVIVSAAFFSGPPHAVRDAWVDGRLQVIVTPAIFDEDLNVSGATTDRGNPIRGARPYV